MKKKTVGATQTEGFKERQRKKQQQGKQKQTPDQKCKDIFDQAVKYG